MMKLCILCLSVLYVTSDQGDHLLLLLALTDYTGTKNTFHSWCLLDNAVTKFKESFIILFTVIIFFANNSSYLVENGNFIGPWELACWHTKNPV